MLYNIIQKLIFVFEFYSNYFFIDFHEHFIAKIFNRIFTHTSIFYIRIIFVG